ncbi:MAG: DUF6090 family protein [Bacteroidota bacterium]
MIKFFRKIRQKLVAKNKFSKYLVYAIGEIILVVVGILIALTINNKNEDHKIRNTALTYLKSLNREFESNLTLLDSTIGEAKGISQAAENVLVLFSPKVLDTVSEKQISQMFGEFNKEAVYKPSNGVLFEVISSGNLKILKNETLKQKLASFEKKVERLQVQEEEVLRLRNEMSFFLRQNGNFTTLFSLNISQDSVIQNHIGIHSNKPIFQSNYMLNSFILYGIIQKSAVSYYYFPLKEELNSIIKLIEDEIEKQS